MESVKYVLILYSTWLEKVCVVFTVKDILLIIMSTVSELFKLFTLACNVIHLTYITIQIVETLILRLTDEHILKYTVVCVH